MLSQRGEGTDGNQGEAAVEYGARRHGSLPCWVSAFTPNATKIMGATTIAANVPEARANDILAWRLMTWPQRKVRAAGTRIAHASDHHAPVSRRDANRTQPCEGSEVVPTPKQRGHP